MYLSAPALPVPDGFTPDEWGRIRHLPADTRGAVVQTRQAIFRSQARLDAAGPCVRPARPASPYR